MNIWNTPVTELHISSVYKARLLDAGITTIGKLAAGWDSVVPDVLGQRHQRVQFQIESELRKLGYTLQQTFMLVPISGAG